MLYGVSGEVCPEDWKVFPERAPLLGSALPAALLAALAC